MNTQQPEALLLADWLFNNVGHPNHAEAAAELRRQHAENETLRAGYAAARLEIESLKAQLHAAKQINAAQFGLLAASIPGSALRASHGQASSQAAEPVAREPLTPEQIAEMMRDTWGCASIAPRHALAFARAVERAHGIKGGQHGTE